MHRSLSVLYLTISCNFLASLFGCQKQRLLVENQFVRHFIGFMSLLVFTDVTRTNGRFKQHRIPVAMGIYAVFVLSTRMRMRWWFAFVVLLMSTGYLLSDVDDENPNEAALESEEEVNQNLDFKNQRNTRLFVTGSILTVGTLLIGFALAYKDRKDIHGSNFSWNKFLIGASKCKT